MTDGQLADPEQWRRHAANLDAIRSLLAEVRAACRRIAQDQAALGPDCGRILSGLDERQARHEETLAYVEETLFLKVQDLHRVADGTQELKAVIGRDGDVMTIDGTPIIEDPPHSLSGLMDSAIDRVHNRDWVEPQLGGAAPVAEFVAPVGDLYAALRSGSLHCAMTCAGPLRQLLDGLTGTSDVAAAHAAVWTRNGADLRQLSVFLRQSLDQDLPHHGELALRSYRALMNYNVEALIGLAEISTTMGIITRAAADLILLTRDIIRGIIGDLFASVTIWISDSRTTVTRPLATARLAIVATTAWRIGAYLTALTDSITTLSRTAGGS